MKQNKAPQLKFQKQKSQKSSTEHGDLCMESHEVVIMKVSTLESLERFSITLGSPLQACPAKTFHTLSQSRAVMA